MNASWFQLLPVARRLIASVIRKMIIKIIQIIGIGIAIHFLSWMFWFYYPFVPILIYFFGGIVSGKLLPDHEFYGGLLVAFPGRVVLGSIVLGQLLRIDEVSGFNLNTIILIELIPTVITAIVGSVYGEQIWRHLKSENV